MQDETETICKLWEAETHVPSSHSRLYHLEPIGVGSSLVESLTSYITRLAEAHSVDPRVLVIGEIAPSLEEFHLYRDGHLVYNHLTAFWQESAILNGVTSGTRTWVRTLERLTLRRDLRFLTMLTFAEAIPPRKLLRRTRAWCPACYEEWRETGQVVYEPLLWALEIITVCPRHHLRLQLHCPYPDCGHILFPLAPHTQPGYCPRCNRWLGSSVKGKAESSPMSEEGWLHWVEQTVGELIATAPTLPVLPRREWTAAAISTYVDAVLEGNQSECARRLQIHPSSLRAWLQGTQFPHLENLIRICFLLRISPLRLLTGNAREVAAAQQQSPGASAEMEKPRRRIRRFDTKGLREALEAVLQHAEDPPPSMHEVALRLGYDPSHLYKHFPNLCQAISRRYQDYRKAMSEERFRRTCDEVREAVRGLHEQGCYPSNRQLSKVLPKPAILREPAVRAVWRETLRELGWDR